MKKIDLCDVTFLIPVRIDSEERLSNLRIVVKNILLHFETKIIIAESGLEKKITDVFDSAIDYHFFVTTEPYFHRTKINNMLIKRCKTQRAIIYDCDVIIPPEQIFESVQKMRQGEFAFALPYDGSFVLVDKYSKAIFETVQDIILLEDKKNIYDVDTLNSVGGCFIFDVGIYSKCGMENENIIGWGHDDVERKKRINILGYHIFRAKGNLYHLYHERTRTSSFFNRELAIKSYEEFFSVYKASPNSLKARISQWTWVNK